MTDIGYGPFSIKVAKVTVKMSMHILWKSDCQADANAKCSLCCIFLH